MPSIRLAVLDDNLYVRTPSGLKAESALFHKFVEAVARTGSFQRVRYLAPVRALRHAEMEPAVEPVNEGLLDVVPTAYFSGIADYVLRSGYMLASNFAPIDRVVASSDLVWLRLPASNALLTLAAARRHHVPHFGWLAGRVGDVVRSQHRPPLARLASRVVADAYDAVSDLAASSGPVVRLDGDMFASVVPASEVALSRATQLAVRKNPPWRIVWAGRMAAEKGLQQLVEAIGLLQQRDLDVTLSLIGDGPAKPEIQRAAAQLRPGKIEWHGFIAEESAYFSLLRLGDLFVYPSHADAAPKVVVEALAAGLPVIANDVGAIRDLLGDGERGRVVSSGDTPILANAIEELLRNPATRQRMRMTALEWASTHTADAQAERLVEWLRDAFPGLQWAADDRR